MAVLRLAIQQAGVPVDLQAVYSGEELLRSLQRALEGPPEKSPSSLPDLVLLDLNMPGLNGFQVLEWLRGRTPFDRIPVIVVSGSDQPVDINRALALGAVRYLVKPHKMTDMVQLVRGIEKFWLKLKAEASPTPRKNEPKASC